MKQLKIRIKLFLQLLKDVYAGHAFRFAGKKPHALSFDYSLELVQKIMPTETAAAKLFNIQTVSEKINPYTLMPNEIFSFWKIAGNPNNGQLQKSRSIINGEIVNEYGGGICQVASIVYHISIMAGLEILERHNHSVDIYTEETRFTPIGTDATVVYGYKDLRIRNSFPFPIKFSIETTPDKLRIWLLSTEPVAQKTLTSSIRHEGIKTLVEIRDSTNKNINTSIYKKLA